MHVQVSLFQYACHIYLLYLNFNVHSFKPDQCAHVSIIQDIIKTLLELNSITEII